MTDITIDHEVRIRLLEEVSKDTRRMLDKLDTKIDSHFRWTLGIMFSMNVGMAGLIISIMFYLIGNLK
jgi:hypothetical protein